MFYRFRRRFSMTSRAKEVLATNGGNNNSAASSNNPNIAPDRSRLNLTQRTKSFLRSNFVTPPPGQTISEIEITSNRDQNNQQSSEKSNNLNCDNNNSNNNINKVETDDINLGRKQEIHMGRPMRGDDSGMNTIRANQFLAAGKNLIHNPNNNNNNDHQVNRNVRLATTFAKSSGYFKNTSPNDHKLLPDNMQIHQNKNHSINDNNNILTSSLSNNQMRSNQTLNKSNYSHNENSKSIATIASNTNLRTNMSSIKDYTNNDNNNDNNFISDDNDNRDASSTKCSDIRTLNTRLNMSKPLYLKSLISSGSDQLATNTTEHKHLSYDNQTSNSKSQQLMSEFNGRQQFVNLNGDSTTGPSDAYNDAPSISSPPTITAMQQKHTQGSMINTSRRKVPNDRSNSFKNVQFDETLQTLRRKQHSNKLNTFNNANNNDIGTRNFHRNTTNNGHSKLRNRMQTIQSIDDFESTSDDRNIKPSRNKQML